MKNVILKRLELTNYRNIEHAVYEFDGNSKIVGENRIGKTNTLESIYFLLSDCLLNGNNDIAAIKPLSNTKAIVKVEGTFDVDGEEFSIGKEYGENWVKERGTQNVNLKGHFANYFINGLKQGTLTAFKNTVNEVFGITEDATVKINFIRLLIDPFYLGDMGDSLDWTNLRSFIIKLVGDVSDADVFNAKPETKVLEPLINKALGKLDVVKKGIKADIDNGKERLLQDDAKIEMLDKTVKPTDEEVEVAKKGVEEGNATISALRSQTGLDVASLEIKNQINDVDSKINELREKELKQRESNPASLKAQEMKAKLDELYKKMDKLVDEKNARLSLNSDCESKIKLNNAQIEKLSKEREGLIARYKEVKSRINNPDSYINTVCPTCHRPLEEEKIKELRDEFVLKANKELEIINNRGLEVKKETEELKTSCDTFKTKMDESSKEINDINAQMEKTRVEINKIAMSDLETPNVESKISPEMQSLLLEKSRLNEQLSKLGLDYQSQLQTVNQKIYDEQSKIEKFQKVLDDLNYYNRQMAERERIVEERDEHSKSLIDAEQNKELLNLFIYTKLRMLDENVSKVFGYIKFQLIKENLNGGFDAVCKPYIFNVDKAESTSVLWKSGSKSERVVTGIAIAECIKEKLGLPNLPFLFDEGGEISSDTFEYRFKTDSQLICVKVEDGVLSPTVMPIN